MATIDDFKYVDDDDDVDAVVVNRLLAATFGRSEYKNVETLAAARQLLDVDLPIQRYDCGGVSRNVLAPLGNAVENHAFFLVNASDGGEVITVRNYADTVTLGKIAEGDGLLLLPDGNGGYKPAGGGGQLTPYRLSVTVDGSNNLILALKNQYGEDPSPTSPVRVQIGDTVRTIVAALSVTIPAGANRFNAGSDELKTREIDYFAYLGYNATDGVVIGAARIPFARIYSDFSATTTNEKYCAISTITTAAASDPYVVIGRFAATLSAGAGYTWTVPTFTGLNLIHQPIYETRPLTWTSVLTGFSGTPTQNCVYVISRRLIIFSQGISGTSNAAGFTSTLPFTVVAGSNDILRLVDNGGAVAGLFTVAASTITYYASVAAAGFTASGTKGVEAITKTLRL